MRELPSSLAGPPIALQKWGERLVAGMMVLAGGEVRMYALCMGSVAATKSTKDKGFSKVLISVFIRAKVRRK
jgi:ribosomal protein L27